jgi:hypothetical protein
LAFLWQRREIMVMATMTTTPPMTHVRITTSCPLSANKNPKFLITIEASKTKGK